MRALSGNGSFSPAAEPACPVAGAGFSTALECIMLLCTKTDGFRPDPIISVNQGISHVHPEDLHRRRSRHHRPADPRTAAGHAADRTGQHRARAAQGPGRQARADGRRGPGHPVPARRGRRRVGGHGRRAGEDLRPTRPQDHRRLHRAPRRTGLGLWLSRNWPAASAGRGAGAPRRQPRLLRDRRHRADAPAGRCRPAAAGLPGRACPATPATRAAAAR